MTAKELSYVNAFFSGLKARITAAEMLETNVLTDQSKLLPKLGGKLFEPDGITWVCTPFYADPS